MLPCADFYSDTSACLVATRRFRDGSFVPCFSLAELNVMPTLLVGAHSNLKVKTPTREVWVSRLTRADGAPRNHEVTVYDLDHDGDLPVWNLVHSYEPR